MLYCTHAYTFAQCSLIMALVLTRSPSSFEQEYKSLFSGRLDLVEPILLEACSFFRSLGWSKGLGWDKWKKDQLFQTLDEFSDTVVHVGEWVKLWRKGLMASQSRLLLLSCFLLSFACPSTLFQQDLKWTLIASFKVSCVVCGVLSCCLWCLTNKMTIKWPVKWVFPHFLSELYLMFN